MNIAETQKVNFEILTAVLDIAERFNIDLWPLGGTEIGAVREKDFIPWDDDVDLQMRLCDYEKLKAALNQELPSHLRVIEPYDMEPYFYDFTIRIADTRFLLREEDDEERALRNLNNHPSVEIFPISKAPDSRFAQRFLYYRCLMLYGQAMGHRYREYHDKTLVQKLGLSLLSFIGKRKSVKKIYTQYWNLTASYEEKNTHTVAHINEVITALNVSARDISWKTAFLPASWFSSSSASEGMIRSRKVKLPIGYHEQLTHMYGDYMTPTSHPEGFIFHLSDEERDEMHRIWQASQH